MRQALNDEREELERAKSEGRIMIGLVGHPNVGKSSMVNSILRCKAVSVKATPRHTKTLQTLILDDTTCLCDSPGLGVSSRGRVSGGTNHRESHSAPPWCASRSAPFVGSPKRTVGAARGKLFNESLAVRATVS